MAKRLKGKEWYEIVSPKLFDNKVIGETLAGDPKTLIGRKIESPLINLIDDLSKYYYKVFFKIKEVKENKVYTEFDSLECLRDYIMRIVRQRIERVDIIQDLETKDKIKVRVKTITIVNRRVSKNLEKSISEFIKKEIEKEVSSNNLDDFVKQIIEDKIKNNILKKGSKIYPLREFEVRKLVRLNK